MKRVLGIHYYFPPLGGIGSVRALKFARYLPDFGWQPTILTPQAGHFHQDRSLEVDGLHIVPTPSIELSREARRLGGQGTQDLAAMRVGGISRPLQRWTRRWLYRPDGQVGWYWFAVQAGRRLLRERKYDALFSSSFPITAHLVASRLARDFALPWLAEFRDPWTQTAEYDSRLRKHLDRAMESRLLQAAQGVATVSESCAELLREQGASHVAILPNGFDPPDYVADDREPENVATYLGSYYPGRQDLDTVLRALGGLRGDGTAGDLGVRFVCAPSPALEQAIRRAGLTDRARVTGFVSNRDALALLVRSRLLLVAGMGDDGARSPGARGVMPAKVFEYLGARRPILYVGDREAEMATLLESCEGTAVVAAGDVSGARAAIKRLLGEPRPRLAPHLMRFTRRELTRRLAEELDRIAS